MTAAPDLLSDLTASSPRLIEKLLAIPYSPQVPQLKQAQFLLDYGLEALYGGAAGGGKDLRAPSRADQWYDPSMEATVITPKGPVLIGDVQVGQQVCSPDGTVANVVAVHHLTDRQFYRVTTADGASVEASGTHLWAVRDRRARKRRKVAVGVIPDGLSETDEWNLRLLQRYTVMTTEQMRQRLLDGHSLAVPLPLPVRLTAVPGRWPILPPYTTGVLLGDGSLTQGQARWHKPEPFIADQVATDVAHLGLVVSGKDEVGSYAIVRPIGADVDSAATYLTRMQLGGLGAHEKFIPLAYLHGSVAHRWAIAQGLFDTDGYADERGHIEYVTTSQRLAVDVQWLLRSLGFTVKISEKPEPHYTYKGEDRIGQPAWRLYVRGRQTSELFRLPRKRGRCSERGVGTGSGATVDMWPDNPVVSIEPTAVDSGICITVDNSNGLYITDDFIVTHNSSALLMAALQFVAVPGYAAMLFRKSYADLSLPGAIMDRAKDWLGGQPGVKWSEIERKFTFSSGASLGFGYIQNENDRLRYQGAELTFVGFDEVTQFKERDYLYLFSRIRRPKQANRALSSVPLRMRCATNPGGPGHGWVHQRFVAPWELHKKATETHLHQVAEGYPSTPPTPLPRTFVPATLLDNEFIDTTEYRKALSNLDPVTRAQLESGDWQIRPEGRIFRKDWFVPVNKVEVPPDCFWVRYWDLAATDANPHTDPDWTAGVLLGWSRSTKLFYIADLVRLRSSPGAVETAILTTAEKDKADPSHVTIRMEQEPGASGKTVIYMYRQKLIAHDFGGDLPSGNKIVRAQLVANKAEPKSDVPTGQMRIVRAAWNEALLDEIEIFPDGYHDDVVDALSGALGVLVRKLGLAPLVSMKNGSIKQSNQWAVPSAGSLRMG